MKLQELYEKENNKKILNEKKVKLVKAIYENPAFEYKNSFELLKASFNKNRHVHH